MMGPRWRAWLRWIITTTACVGAGLLLLLTFAWSRYGTVIAATHALRGDPIICDRYTTTVAPGGQKQICEFRLTNRSARAIRLLGAQTTCTCVVVTGLPRSLAAGELLVLQVRVRPDGRDPSFSTSIRIFTDESTLPALELQLASGAA